MEKTKLRRKRSFGFTTAKTFTKVKMLGEDVVCHGEEVVPHGEEVCHCEGLACFNEGRCSSQRRPLLSVVKVVAHRSEKEAG